MENRLFYRHCVRREFSAFAQTLMHCFSLHFVTAASDLSFLAVYKAVVVYDK